MNSMATTMTMAMAATATTTAGGGSMVQSAATPTPTHMHMGMGSCKTQMLWNWHTIGACFLSSTWQIQSRGAFAGLCIGVVLLAVLLEVLRRAPKAFDGYLVRRRRRYSRGSSLSAAVAAVPSEAESIATKAGLLLDNANADAAASASAQQPLLLRPTVWEQLVRALLHTAHFAVAYWLMLFAMYYNGYIIVCIFTGAFLGYFMCQWDLLEPR
ncbi:putative high affinity copper protein [Xylariaceae sp. FL0804]|nr:putative high affinity copper protein [Xylariaceae sp. FL0804]